MVTLFITKLTVSPDVYSPLTVPVIVIFPEASLALTILSAVILFIVRIGVGAVASKLYTLFAVAEPILPARSVVLTLPAIVVSESKANHS